MAGIRDKPEIEIEEYEIVGNWAQASVRKGATDNRAVSIQEPTFNEQLDSMAHTERPTEVSFAGEENESHTVIVEVHSTAIIDIFSTTANYEQFNPWIA